MDGPKRSRYSGSNNGGGGGGGIVGGMSRDYDNSYNTYGLSTSFLDSLGINGPLHTKVFVANLDHKVNEKKLKQCFKLAGKIVNLDLSTDKDGNSKGYAVIEYEHPVEAVQAISLLDRQMLYDRRMTVRLDRLPNKTESVRLPDGLGGLGIGLGPNGEPLRNVAKNLPNQYQNSNMNQSSNSMNNAAAIAAAASLFNMGGGGNIGGGSISSGNIGGGGGGGGGNIGGGTNAGNTSGNNAGTGNMGGMNDFQNSNSNIGYSSGMGSNLGGGGGGGGMSGNMGGGNMGGGGGNMGGGGGIGVGGGRGSGSVTGGYGNSSFNNGRGNDFDMVTSNNNMRSYNTQQQDNMQSNFGGAGNNSNIAGRNIGNDTGNDTIVIRNLPMSCTWQTLRDKFCDIGEVKFAEIRGNDCGVVRFAKERDAQLAIKLMDGARFDGSTVQVMFF